MPKEYIEREKLKDSFDYSQDCFQSEDDYNLALTTVEGAEIADVVEVVRCKECKYAQELTHTEKQIYTNDCVMCSQIHPDGRRIPMLLNSFCSYGERKDDEK